MSDENIYMVEKNGQTAMLYRIPGTQLYHNSHDSGQKPLNDWLSQWSIKKD